MQELITETLKRISLEQNAKEINETLVGEDADQFLVHKDYNLQDLRKALGLPPHKKGAFETTVLEDYVNYCREEKSGSTGFCACFINPDHLNAKTIFDLGSIIRPDFNRNSATYTLELTEEYRQAMQSPRIASQQDMTFWLEEMKDFIEKFTDPNGETIEHKAAINALRNVTISAISESTTEESDFKTAQTGLASIEAKSSQGDLPARVHFKLEPSADLPQVCIESRIIIRSGGKKPEIMLQVFRKEQIAQQLAKDFKALIQKHLEPLDGVATYVGTYQG